jgi:hypothetical protein
VGVKAVLRIAYSNKKLGCLLFMPDLASAMVIELPFVKRGQGLGHC